MSNLVSREKYFKMSSVENVTKSANRLKGNRKVIPYCQANTIKYDSVGRNTGKGSFGAFADSAGLIKLFGSELRICSLIRVFAVRLHKHWLM